MKKASLTLENGNTIYMELFEQAAPNTVGNFEKLSNEGFYDGLTFHRVIAGFVAQGGCPQGTGVGGAGYTIKCETSDNPHKHQKGSLAMAHAGKDTGSCQFYIAYDVFPHLDGIHTVFGHVVEGMEFAESIKQEDKIKELRVFSPK